MENDIVWFNDKGLRIRTDQVLVHSIDLAAGTAERCYSPFCDACMGMGANEWQRKYGKVCSVCQGSGDLSEVNEPVFTEQGLVKHREEVAQLAAEEAAREAQVEAERQERERPTWLAWCESHADLIASVRREVAARPFEENLMRFLKRVDTVRIPTQKQTDGVTRSIEYFARRAEWEAKRAALPPSVKTGPAKRRSKKASFRYRRSARWYNERSA